MTVNPTNTSTSTFGAPVLHPAWDKYARWALRAKPIFRQFVDVTDVAPTNNAKITYLPVHGNMSVAGNRSELDEVNSPASLQPPATYYVRVLLKEHGDPIGRTQFLGDTAYIDVDPVLARQGGQLMVDTVDALVSDVLYSGAQVRSNGHVSAGNTHTVTDTTVAFNQKVTSNAGAIEFTPVADNTLLKTDTLSSQISSRIVARLRGASAEPRRGALYVGIMHPDTAVDYQDDVGAAVKWHEPHKYQDTSALYTGETGSYRGVAWIESAKAPFLAGAGAAGVRVYQTVIFGREVLAQVVKREPGMDVAPMTDDFKRHYTITWFGELGFSCFRQEPLWRVHHGSTVDPT